LSVHSAARRNGVRPNKFRASTSAPRARRFRTFDNVAVLKKSSVFQSERSDAIALMARMFRLPGSRAIQWDGVGPVDRGWTSIVGGADPDANLNRPEH